jgi:type IV secretion system protein VirB10
MLFGTTTDSAMRGDRGRPIVARALSLQSRLSNALALALMLGIGAAFLCWYYLHRVNQPSRARQSAQSSLSARNPAEITLPPLGRLEMPEAKSSSEAPSELFAVSAQNSLTVPASIVTAVPAAGTATGGQSVQATVLERRLSGAAFASAEHGTAPSPSSETAAVSSEAKNTSTDSLSTLLSVGAASALSARWLPEQRMLLPKGAFIDCTLETAIDSSLPGLTTCVTATDTFGADGRVVLLERGTKLVGETRGQVQQGTSRVFVLWTEARTPAGVRVPLDSPGADELGRTGLPGQVERHFWERFGAAILISTLDGGVQAAVQSASRGSGQVIYGPSGPQDVTTEVLKGTLTIAPTVIKRNGDRIQVLVARDVDFSRVYELRRAVVQP